MTDVPTFSASYGAGITDEDMWALYREVLPKQEAFDKLTPPIADNIRIITEHMAPEPARAVQTAMMQIFLDEPVIQRLRAPNEVKASERNEYVWSLYAKQHFFQYQHELLHQLCLAIAESMLEVMIRRGDGRSPLRVKFGSLFDNPASVIDSMRRAVVSANRQYGCFLGHLAVKLIDNQSTKASGGMLSARESSYVGEKLIDSYLEGTPFHALMTTLVPLHIPQSKRFEHTHILGGSGAGKTSLLETFLLHDIRDPGQPSIVVLEPHASLIKEIAYADLGIEDRLIIIDPTDIEHPPQINLFDLNRSAMKAYSRADREQSMAATLSTLAYAFSGILDTELTGRQRIFFEYCVHMMFVLPDAIGRNATVRDLYDLVVDGKDAQLPEFFHKALPFLSDIQREFFERDFKTDFKDTKSQMRYRLFGLLGNPTFERLFTSTDTRLDFGEELERGSIILINASNAFLDANAGPYGRIFLSLILRAMLNRAIDGRRRPTYVYVDEAAQFFGDGAHIDRFLTETRKFNCGIHLAHHDLSPSKCSPALLSSLRSSTSTKLAGGVGTSDARVMAAEMRTSPEFLLAQPALTFACYIRGLTGNVLSTSVPYHAIASVPQLYAERHAALIERSRARVSLPKSLSTAKPSIVNLPAAPPIPPDDDEAFSRKW